MKKVNDFGSTYCDSSRENYKALISKGVKPDLGMSTDSLGIMEYIVVYACGKRMWYQAPEQKKPVSSEIKLIYGEFYYADSIDATNSKFILGSDTHYCPDCEKQVITKEHNCLIHPTKLNDKDFKEHTDIVFNTDFVKPHNCRISDSAIIDKECQFAKYGFKKPDFECEILKDVIRDDFSYLVGYIVLNRDNEDILYSCYWTKKGLCKFIIPVLDCNIDTCADCQEDFDLTPIKKPWYEEEGSFPKAMIDDSSNSKRFFLSQGKENYLHAVSSGHRHATKEEVLSLYKEEK